MPQILFKKEGGIYKYHKAIVDETFLCDTFHCASSPKNLEKARCDAELLDTTVAGDVTKSQSDPSTGYELGLLPQDVRIGPPQHGKRNYSATLNNSQSNGVNHQSTSQRQSGLAAAKLQCNEWGLPNNIYHKKNTTAIGNGNSSYGLKHPSVKSHTYFSKTQYLKKRRNAIDLGRRTRVLGKFLQSIEEEEDYELETENYCTMTEFSGYIMFT